MLRSPANALSDVCAALAGAIGLSALLGWSGQFGWLGFAIENGPGIRPVTGACLLALSLALITARRISTGSFVGATRGTLVAALLVSGAIAAWGLTHLFLGIGAPQRASSPHTITAMLLLGAGIALSIHADRLRRRASVVCALGGGLITWLALLGYLTGMPLFFAVPGDPSTGISVVTAFTLLVLSVGVMGLFPDHGFVELFLMRSEGGTLMRMLLPAAVLFPLVAGGFFNHGEHTGWFDHDVALALNLGVTSLIIIGLVLWIGLIFKRREAEQRAAAEERELLLANLRTSLDQLSTLQNNLVTVCAWTQRVLDEGKWVRFEEFLGKRLNITITHGISEDAAKAELQSLEDWMADATDRDTSAPR